MAEARALGAVRSPVMGEGSLMQGVLRAARRIAPSEATVLITGETGTGKEVMARFIHEHSTRAGFAFVPMNCAAIPEALLESELFGHVRGAFTGAVAARKGRLAMAEGGTLFLDEVGELPLALQVKLLRMLQERVYEPVGGNESVSANFRLIAATNRDLAAEVEAGRFRRDLYYRLMVCPVELPPLRERIEDIGVLFDHFWRERGERRPIEGAVYQLLTTYSWPGNVRELENLVERVSVLAEGPTVGVQDIPHPVRPAPAHASPGWAAARPSPLVAARREEAPAAELPRPPPTPPPPSPPSSDHGVLADDAVPGSGEASTPRPVAPVALVPPLAEARATPPPPPSPAGFPVDLPTLLRRIEDDYIDAALERAGGNKKAAADLLGLQRTTLVEKLRRRLREAPSTALASGA